jgi:undecaprenyl-diphosphatase
MSLDDNLFLEINRALSSAHASLFFSNITRLGDGLLLAFVILLPMFCFQRERFKRHAVPMVLSVALSGLVVFFVKAWVDRPRPKDRFSPVGVQVHAPLGTPGDRSFPSGHTQTAFGAATYLSCLYPRFAPAFLVIAGLVGLSRIAIGVHFPLDVLVGALIGSLFSILGFWWVTKRNQGLGRQIE